MSDYIVGLTGGVAAGKSSLAARFERLGAFVSDADRAARAALAAGSTGLAEVVAAFGRNVLTADGQLDRPAMRQRIFSDAAARSTLEAIVHPRVRRAMRAECEAAGTAYAIAVIPLLAEAGRAAYPWLNRVLWIDTPEHLQLERLLQRDGIDEALARQMIAAQASREQRRAVADDVLFNDGPLETLDLVVTELDAIYRARGALPPDLPCVLF